MNSKRPSLREENLPGHLLNPQQTPLTPQEQMDQGERKTNSFFGTDG